MSCLFDSLSTFTTHSSAQLREHIVAYLSTNPTLMDNTSFQNILEWDSVDFQQYIGSMRQSNTWGGAIEIKAFVNMFKVNVFVHIPHQQRRVVEFVYDQSQKDGYPTVHILWTGNHFVPLPSPPSSSSNPPRTPVHVQHADTSVAIHTRPPLPR